MVARQQPRARLRIRGPETWRDDRDALWSHWDLWFCLVWTVDFDTDRDDFSTELHRRHGHPLGRPDRESFLSHLADLAARLDARGLTPRALVGDAGDDRKLIAKARRKVLQQGLSPEVLTQAMIETPRARIGRRALQGRWERFPVSPDTPYQEFAALLARRAADRSRRYGLVRPFQRTLQRLERSCGDDPARHLAVLRAFLAAGIEAMDRNLGSHGVVEILTEGLLRYVALPWRETGIALEDYYPDLCDLLAWESYAITYERETESFRLVRAEEGDLVEGILLAFEREYRGHGLVHHAMRALECIAYLAVALRRFDRMVPNADALGPDGWVAVEAMARCALDHGYRDLARAVFESADRPGLLRDNLRFASARLLGEEPTGRPSLRLVR